jgi:hypothetical protein
MVGQIVGFAFALSDSGRRQVAVTEFSSGGANPGLVIIVRSEDFFAIRR